MEILIGLINGGDSIKLLPWLGEPEAPGLSLESRMEKKKKKIAIDFNTIRNVYEI